MSQQYVAASDGVSGQLSDDLLRPLVCCGQLVSSSTPPTRSVPELSSASQPEQIRNHKHLLPNPFGGVGARSDERRSGSREERRR